MFEQFKKGKWLITLEDNSKWVLDFDSNSFDSWEWYKTYGTLENELNYEELKKYGKSIRKI